MESNANGRLPSRDAYLKRSLGTLSRRIREVSSYSAIGLQKTTSKSFCIRSSLLINLIS
jgi:hypothetical protein